MKDSSSSELENTTNSKKNSTKKSHPKVSLPCSLYTSRLSICLLSVFAISFVLLQIRSLQTPPRTIIHQWEKIINISCLAPNFHKNNGVLELKSLTSKLQESATFLPLKDLRYSHVPMKGHTWFMSSMYDTHEEGEVQYQQFPTKASSDRVLCLKGRDTHDGSWNSYALAWRDTLPPNATLMDGMTFVSYNHYDYYNIWHGLSAMMPFVAWHIKNQCSVPRRWILYHWGEVRTSMAPWLSTLLEASFGVPIRIETFDEIYRNKTKDSYQPVCFEEAVVMRHNEGGMSRLKRMEVYDLMRCKSRMYCNVGSRSYNDSSIGLAMLMRDGGRSFKNSSAVISIFEKECKKVEGCRLMVAYPHNLTFCEQVKLMSATDIVISAHGAQLSNMILMDRNSSVMELFPKGWLELAGVGQYVHHWLASWSGMRHEGAWRDPEPSNHPCMYPDKDVRCMSSFKNGKIGHNESYFSDWAKRVLKDVRLRKLGQVGRGMTKISSPVSGLCGCD